MGSEAEILEPASTRDSMRDIVAKLSATYTKPRPHVPAPKQQKTKAASIRLLFSPDYCDTEARVFILPIHENAHPTNGCWILCRKKVRLATQVGLDQHPVSWTFSADPDPFDSHSPESVS